MTVEDRLSRIESMLSKLLERHQKKYYTTQQAARILCLKEDTIRDWCNNGKLEGAQKVPGRSSGEWRIPALSIDNLGVTSNG